MIKKALCLMLSLLLVAPILYGCGTAKSDDGATDTEPAAETTPAAQETIASEYKPDALPENLDFGGKEINILSRSYEWVADEISVEKPNGDTINDAVFNRNLKVEERLKIKIVNTLVSGGDNYAITSAVRLAIQSGTHDFDIFANSVYSTCYVTAENLYRNLLDVKYLDLDGPWWSSNFNKAISLGKGQYFATGAAALSYTRFIYVTFFNKRLCEENNIEDLYKVVSDGRWTYDYLYTLTEGLYKDLNGDGTRGIEDRYGLGLGEDTTVDAFWSAFKLPIIVKDNDNWPVLAIDSERTATALERINKLTWENPGSYKNPDTSELGQFTNLENKFANGELVMTFCRLISTESEALRNMSDDYGIIPYPKYDSAQDDYYSYAHDQFTAFGLPNNLSDDEADTMGAVLEALASESYRSLQPEYFNVALKYKYARDSESWNMINLIVDNFYIDTGVLYTKSMESVHQLLRKLVQQKSSNWASLYKTYEKIINKRIAVLTEGVEKIQAQ